VSSPYNETRREHGQSLVSVGRYLQTGHPWQALFENWESEFLQMAVFVLLTTVLVQRGSPESRRPRVKELVDIDPRDFADDPGAPWPVRRGGWVLRLYEYSLGLAFIGLFVLSWAGHALGGFREFADDSVAHGGLPPNSGTTCGLRDSGSSRSRIGRASSWPSRRWSGWRCTSDSAIRRNRNRSTLRMARQGDDVSRADRLVDSNPIIRT